MMRLLVPGRIQVAMPIDEGKTIRRIVRTMSSGIKLRHTLVPLATVDIHEQYTWPLRYLESKMHGPHGLSLICAYIPCSNILTLLSFALKKALRHWTHLWHEHYLQHHRKACRLASFPWLSLAGFRIRIQTGSRIWFSKDSMVPKQHLSSSAAFLGKKRSKETKKRLVKWINESSHNGSKNRSPAAHD